MKSPLRVTFLLVAAFAALSIRPVLWSYASTPPGSVLTGPQQLPVITTDSIVIPGPLRSLERMAGISQEVSASELVPLLAHNIYTEGYQLGKPTEFLLLVDRYLEQARELQILAQPSGKIQVNNCDDAGTLVHILGYRLRQRCGDKNFSLETANPTRAFLTIDSGFPLVELEEALQNGHPFVYSYPSSRVPVLFHQGDWVGLRAMQRRDSRDLLDVLLNDALLARLYWAMSQEDTETAAALQKAPGLGALLPYAPVLEFYGNELSIRNNRVNVPGGSEAERAWRDLVGVSPESPGPFVLSLFSKDKGWLAAYFDTLSRISQEQQKHLTEPARLKHLYQAFESGNPGFAATQGVFRRTPDLLVLFTRLEWEQDVPHVPGGLDVWKSILREKSSDKTIRDVGRRARRWNNPEQLLEGMTELTQVETDTGPLQMYLTALEIDRNRQSGRGLSADTVRLLGANFAQFGSWYQSFTEFPELDDASITRFINLAREINRTSDQNLRANCEGSFQATVGLWQILARQGEIAPDQQNATWLKVIEPFSNVDSSVQLFDASRASLEQLLTAGGDHPSDDQAEIIDLLAGPKQDTADGQKMHAQLATRISAVLDDQRLVSLNTLFGLSDGLKAMAESHGKGDGLLPLAEELREFDLPQPIFTNSEKITWAPRIYTNHHAELQVKTDLTKIIKGSASPQQLENARGQLAPFLRDTLVGLNYAYYEPPDAQMLHHNPLFVRSHDFLGISILGAERLWGAPRVLGVGTPAGGGAYLMGSLSDLPYALATTEEDFIAPRNIQALIWKEIVPVLMVSATIHRWWNVTPYELHAVTLYQKSGEELLEAATKDPQLRAKVTDLLADRFDPQRLEEVEDSLSRAADVNAILPQLTPAETSYIAVEFHERYPHDPADWGPATRQLGELQKHYGAEVSWERIAHDFGVPHPTLAQTSACEVLNIKPFPFFGSYSSRLFGESWESSNLYWARLADEMGYSPAALNMLVPELTHRMIANIFATDIEDWPAVLRALRETGDEFRKGKIAVTVSPSQTLQGANRVVQNSTVQ